MRVLTMTIFIFVMLSPLCLSDTIIIPTQYSTIQKGIDSALNGDTVLVLPGTYSEQILIQSKDIILKSYSLPQVTIIDGSNTHKVMILEKTSSIIDGFTITNGYENNSGLIGGAGIYIDSSGTDKYEPVVKNCIIKNNTNATLSLPIAFGGGIYIKQRAKIINNIISKNQAYFGAGIYITNGVEKADCVVEGNNISENNHINSYYTGEGAGIYAEWAKNILIKNNNIVDHKAFHYIGPSIEAVGISIHSSENVDIINNYINNNIGEEITGGVLVHECDNVLVKGNEISENMNNYAHVGGFRAVNIVNLEMVNNHIVKNEAPQSGSGGCSFWKCINVSINRCHISQNESEYSAACSMTSGVSLLIENSIIDNNVASLYSNGSTGGMTFYDYNTVRINNCIFKNNSAKKGGGAINCIETNSMDITNCTFYGNTAPSGAGVFRISDTDPIITNCILWGNSTPILDILGSSNPSIKYCDIQGGHAGVGNINLDPLWVDPNNDDFHLTFQSPCKDAGDNSVLNLPSEDLEGDPRIANGIVDMGADEFHTRLYSTGDPTPGSNISLKFIDTPLTSPVTLFLGSGVLNNPLVLPPHGDWHLQFPILMQVNFGSIPANGCLSFTSSVPYGLPTPLDLPFQAGIGIKLTNLLEIHIE